MLFFLNITAKLEASFFVNGEQHTHLSGLFFDWASIGFGLFFVWAIGTLDKAHDHELRNPVSLDSLEKHQKSIRNASETHQKSIRKALEKET